MKIKIIQTCMLLLSGTSAFSQGLLVQSGATFKTTGNVSIVIENGSLTNNGTSDLAGSNVYFKGTSSGSLGGTANLSLNNLYINRPGQSITLAHDVSIASQVVLQGGLLDLNGRTVTLSSSGSVSGETETNRIVGPLGGEIMITLPMNAPLAQNAGNLGAIINSASDLGTVTVKRGHKPFNNVLGSNSIMRYYDIVPANNSGLDAFLRFTYLDAEKNGLDEGTLKMFRSVDNGLTWTDQGFSGRNTTLNFVDLSGINSFSKWTLSTPSAVPVTLTNFKASCTGSTVSAQWETATEFNADKFLVQRSKDAGQWETIGSVNAAGNSVVAQKYTWSDNNPVNGYAFYRLQQIDKDGKVSYSPVVGAGCMSRNMPALTLYPNPAKDMVRVRIVSPDGQSGTLSLHNILGQVVYASTINLMNGVYSADINLSQFAKGTYKLVYSVNGKEEMAVKLIKQ